MLPEDKFFQMDEDRIWQRYCGFLDLTLQDFMAIQMDLLKEQIDLVTTSPLGRKIMNNRRPQTVEEFRHVVPLTTYEDYAPYLGKQREDALAAKPYAWAHTSGRGGSLKWVPYTQEATSKWCRNGIALMILSSAEKKGEIRVYPGVKVLLNVPQRPYASGLICFFINENFSITTLPPLEKSEKMEFQERIKESFRLATKTGMDFVFCAISSTLIKVAEGFAQQKMKPSLFMLHPAVLLRFARAQMRSKRVGRPLLPRDLWNTKGIFTCGPDTAIYRDKLAYYWGKSPLEFYVFSEALFIATQAWNKKGMTFFPDTAFLEFIPEAEWLKSRENNEYQPSTVLLDEVRAGEVYEIVATSFYGMPFLRYRPGDLIKIISLKDDETGIKLPQMVFHARANDIIDVYDIARLDEKTVWQAIVNTKVDYQDWSMRMEPEQGEPIVCLYIEPKQEIQAQELELLLHEQLKVLDRHYEEAVTTMGRNPLRVKPLRRGAFQHYFEEKRRQGADLSHLKPPHMNASNEVIQALLRLREGNQ